MPPTPSSPQRAPEPPRHRVVMAARYKTANVRAAVICSRAMWSARHLWGHRAARGQGCGPGYQPGGPLSTTSTTSARRLTRHLPEHELAIRDPYGRRPIHHRTVRIQRRPVHRGVAVAARPRCVAPPCPAQAAWPTSTWSAPTLCPCGHRAGGWVIHFPAVVCTSWPNAVKG
jgi:hypothetical protein